MSDTPPCGRRGTAFWLRELARALVQLLAVVLRPLVRAAADFRAALTHPHRLVGLLLPLAAGAALVFYVRTTLAQPFVLRVEVGGQTVGYLPGEQAFEAARADVQARISGAADWDIQPEYTLVWGAGVQTMTRTRDRRRDFAGGGRRHHRKHRRLHRRHAAVHHHRGRPPAPLPVRRAPALADRGGAD